MSFWLFWLLVGGGLCVLGAIVVVGGWKFPIEYACLTGELVAPPPREFSCAGGPELGDTGRRGGCCP